MIVACQVVELGVRQEVVVEEGGREGRVREAGGDVEERVQGRGEVGEFLGEG